MEPVVKVEFIEYNRVGNQLHQYLRWGIDFRCEKATELKYYIPGRQWHNQRLLEGNLTFRV